MVHIDVCRSIRQKSGTNKLRVCVLSLQSEWTLVLSLTKVCTANAQVLFSAPRISIESVHLLPAAWANSFSGPKLAVDMIRFTCKKSQHARMPQPDALIP